MSSIFERFKPANLKLPTRETLSLPKDMHEPRTWIDRKRKRFWAVVALVLYTFIGFVVVPAIARPQIETAVSRALDRPAALEELRINPFLMSVDARGFALTEADGAPIFAFERFYARFRLSSLFRWAWSFHDIRLEGASLDVVRYASTETNLSRLIPPPDPDAPPPEPAESSDPVRLIIRSAALSNAVVNVTDRVPQTPFETRIGPINVALNNVSTLRGDEGADDVVIETEDGLRLEWSGVFSINPLYSKGGLKTSGPYPAIALDYLQDTITISAPTGVVDLGFDYTLETDAAGEIQVAIENGAATVRDLAIRQGETDIFELPSMSISGGFLNWPAAAAGAQELIADGPRVLVRRDADGAFNFETITAASETATETEPAAPSAPDTDPAAPPPNAWDFSLQSFNLKNAGVRFTDEAVSAPTTLEARNITLSATSVTNAPNARSPFSFAADLVSGGALRAEGEASLIPAFSTSLRTEISDLKLPAAQPYVQDVANILIENGALDVVAEIAAPSASDVRVDGRLAIADLNIRDTVNDTQLLAWDRLNVDRYELDLDARSFVVSEIGFDAPFARFRINEDGSTNLDEVFATSGEQQDPSPAPSTGDAPPAAALTIGRVVVDDGGLSFADLSLPIPFSTAITNLEGALTTVSTSSAQPAELALDGAVGDFGRVKITGAAIPGDPKQNTRIDIAFENIDVPDYSPYTVKFAGRRIASGKVDLNLVYAIDRSELAGENSAVISDLELGERVDQDGAMNLPLGLAIALLKGPDGKIDVSVPVRGNVDDPEFQLGGAIARAIFGFITNVATAPFRLLGNLVGLEGDDADKVEFDPGSAELTPPQREKLLKLAQALAARPALILEAPGAYVEDADAAALKEDRVIARITEDAEARQSAEMLWNEARRAAIESLFAAQFPAEPLEDIRAENSRPPSDSPDAAPILDETAYLAALEDRLIGAEPITDADLQQLASERAAAVAAALTAPPTDSVADDGGETDEPAPIAAERIVVGAPEPGELTERGAIALKFDVRPQNE